MRVSAKTCLFIPLTTVIIPTEVGNSNEKVWYTGSREP